MKILENLKTIENEMQTYEIVVPELLTAKSALEIETLKSTLTKITQTKTEIETTISRIEELLTFLNKNQQYSNTNDIINRLTNYDLSCKRFLTQLKAEAIDTYLKIEDLKAKSKIVENKPAIACNFDEVIAPALVDLYTNKNFISKLSAKLKNKFTITFKPQNQNANIIKGKQLCVEANKILSKNQNGKDIQNYEFVINHLELAKNYFSESDNKPLFDLCQKSIENVETLLTQSIKAKADDTFKIAIDLYIGGYIADGKNNFTKALKLYQKINDDKMLAQTKKYIENCNYILISNDAKEKYSIGVSKLNNEEFDDAEYYLISAKVLFEKINNTEDIINCKKMLQKNKTEKQKYIDKCKNNAFKYYNDANNCYENEMFVNAIQNFEEAIKWFKKFDNQTSINLCCEAIKNCKIGQGNQLFSQAYAEMTTSPRNAIEMFEQAIKFYTETGDNKFVDKCNEKIAECNNLIGNEYYDCGCSKRSNDECLEYFLTALKHYKKANCQHNIEICSNMIADYFFKKGTELFNNRYQYLNDEANYQDLVNLLNNAIECYKQTINYSYNENKTHHAKTQIIECKNEIEYCESSEKNQPQI